MKRRCGSEPFRLCDSHQCYKDRNSPRRARQKSRTKMPTNKRISVRPSSETVETVFTKVTLSTANAILTSENVRTARSNGVSLATPANPPGKGRIGNPGERNATDRCRAREEFDSSGGWNSNLGKNGISIAELRCEIRERNNQRDTIWI